MLKRKLYDRNVKKFVGARTKLNENHMKRIKEEWNDIKAKAVLSYKATYDYKTVAMFIDKINKFSKTMDVNKRGNRRISYIEYSKILIMKCYNMHCTESILVSDRLSRIGFMIS